MVGGSSSVVCHILFSSGIIWHLHERVWNRGRASPRRSSPGSKRREHWWRGRRFVFVRTTCPPQRRFALLRPPPVKVAFAAAPILVQNLYPNPVSPGQGPDLSDPRRSAVVDESDNDPVLISQVPHEALPDPVRRAAATVLICKIFAPPRSEDAPSGPPLRLYSRVNLGQHPLGSL